MSVSLEALAFTTASAKSKLEKEEDNLYEEWSEGEKTVLAIIAYNGPISILGIDKIMGTDCSHYVVSLQERGLIMRKNNKFIVTPSFFGFLGIKDSTELPSLEDKNGLRTESDSKFEDINFSHFDHSLIEERAIGFDYQWLK